MTRPYSDITYTSSDGLQLYARDYAAPGSGVPLLCMHGLTRNSADFHPLAEKLMTFRIISVDQRGRGRSEWDSDTSRYRPDVYCNDMMMLMEQLSLDQVVAVGTSMGGLMAMMMSLMRPGLFKAAIINDIGPEVEPAGIARLRSYVGKSTVFPSWAEAIESIKAQGPDIFPDFNDQDWLDFATRTCRENASGDVQFDYDPAISQGVSEEKPSAVPPDLWPVFDGLSEIPLLLIRGENSDILSSDTARQMTLRHPNCQLTTVQNRGHAPVLDEPEAVKAIRSFLEVVL